MKNICNNFLALLSRRLDLHIYIGLVKKEQGRGTGENIEVNPTKRYSVQFYLVVI